MRMRTMGLLAALTLVAGGCAGSDEEQAKEALSASIMEESDSFQVTQSEADCVAGGFVDEIGVDQLQDYGIVTEEGAETKNLDEISMSEEDADAAAGAFVECVDVQELLTDQIPTQGMDPAVVQCMQEALTDDVLRDVLAATFRGEDAEALSPAITDKLTACIDA